MWAVAFALYAGCKWLTFAEAISMRGSPRPARAIGYLFAWPGMDACSFLRGSPAKAPPWRALAWGIFNVLAGVISVWVLTPALISQSPLLAGWVGMIGVVLFLHFGIFAILAWLWQRLGVSATPVMRSPLAATSLGEFWSKRWNTAFHSLAQHCIFQPLKARLGARGAAITVFFVSGLTHDLVISVPARAGFGLPTLYFLVQGFGVLFERTTVARKLGLGKGTRGWLFALIVAAGPSFLLCNYSGRF
jgi:alginate O-acetyltransferase complex protein AlgI